MKNNIIKFISSQPNPVSIDFICDNIIDLNMNMSQLNDILFDLLQENKLDITNTGKYFIPSNDDSFRCTLRIPKKMLFEMDLAMSKDTIKKSRNLWILQAIDKVLNGK